MAPTVASAATLQAVDVGHDRVTLRFAGKVERAQSFSLRDPARIAIDLPGVTPPPARLEGSGGVIAAIRSGWFDPGTTRVVFDLAHPAVITSGAIAKDGRSLTLALVRADPKQWATAAAAPRQTWRADAAGLGQRPRYSLNIPLDPPRTGPPPIAIAGPKGRPLVVIDAGHGGHDPGAIGPGGLREKDVTLAIARTIRDTLLKGGRVRVALTRNSDRFLILRERAQLARAVRADLFISIHADSAPTPQATGATVYTLSEVASDATAARLAARENKADIINGVNLAGQEADVSSILIDLAQRETMNASSRFASVLRREAGDRVPFKGDYHRMAGFAVLKAPDTPAVLLEVGYITNEADAARINSRAGRQAIADAVRRAVDVQFARAVAAVR